MRHKKEWHTCDRCGAEIDKIPSRKQFLHKKNCKSDRIKNDV